MKPHGRPRCRSEDDIKMDLWPIGYKDVNYILLGHERVQKWAPVNTVMSMWGP
jgi:hypothetical protein